MTAPASILQPHAAPPYAEGADAHGGEPPALVLQGLHRAFGTQQAVRDVSFSLAMGDVCAFLGPNGAGKSTTMRMVAGLLDPDAGDCRIMGHSVTSDRLAALAKLGFLAEGAPLPLDLSVREFLRFAAGLRAIRGKALPDAIARAAQAVAIEDVLERRIEQLSKGYRRRVALAGALIHDPPVLVLDEPTDGLDPNQKVLIRQLVAQMRPTKAILISTHALDEVEAMASRVIVLAQGQVVAQTQPDILAREPGGLFAAFQRLTQGAIQ